MEKAIQQAHQPAVQLYLDDLYVGQRFTSGTYVMEAARIKEFAAEFDPQPFHLDEAAARMSLFKGLVASGWHTAAVAMRLLVTGGLPFANGIVGFGGQLSWPRPTRPGDILRVESEIVEITPSRSKPHQAGAKFDCRFQTVFSPGRCSRASARSMSRWIRRKA